jgi:multidrug transporter EmrE-like cation transporter
MVLDELQIFRRIMLIMLHSIVIDRNSYVLSTSIQHVYYATIYAIFGGRGGSVTTKIGMNVL